MYTKLFDASFEYFFDVTFSDTDMMLLLLLPPLPLQLLQLLLLLLLFCCFAVFGIKENKLVNEPNKCFLRRRCLSLAVENSVTMDECTSVWLVDAGEKEHLPTKPGIRSNQPPGRTAPHPTHPTGARQEEGTKESSEK